jgi:hypothetical protein
VVANQSSSRQIRALTDLFALHRSTKVSVKFPWIYRSADPFGPYSTPVLGFSPGKANLPSIPTLRDGYGTASRSSDSLDGALSSRRPIDSPTLRVTRVRKAPVKLDTHISRQRSLSKNQPKACKRIGVREREDARSADDARGWRGRKGVRMRRSITLVTVAVPEGTAWRVRSETRRTAKGDVREFHDPASKATRQVRWPSREAPASPLCDWSPDLVAHTTNRGASRITGRADAELAFSHDG